MALRNLVDNEKYKLDQSYFISVLENYWGVGAIDNAPHHNDQLRLFGTITSIPEYRDMYQKLATGVTHRHMLDNPVLNFPETFTNLAVAFNNEEVIVTLPGNAYDPPP